MTLYNIIIYMFRNILNVIKNLFSQLINKPTRNNNIIDLLFTNE